ncbi:MAG: prolyl oligopeptidase family serine peptidase [Bacteroidota bacterium]|nr:prolyl oligopeptidase family serine peptidase [Bacteroidota bacterium]
MKIKKIFIISLSLFLTASALGQNGQIIFREQLDLLSNKDLQDIVYLESDKQTVLKPNYQYLDNVKIEKISYLSDGLEVIGYMASPIQPGTYPAIIYNRGGNKEFGQLNNRKAAFILARVASWGYVVVASQYRGNDGGEGREEFGGKDVNDVLNLIPFLKELENVKPKKLGLYGWSRGGMMTYLSLMRTGEFKAACVGGGLSDLYMMIETRPDMEEVYQDLIPDYDNNKESALNARSAIFNIEKISKNTPILMLHGTSDWRVVPQMALDLAEAFNNAEVPYRLVMLEGGDHGLNEHNKEVDRQVRMWFDRFVKNGEKLPLLEPHGR